MAICNQTLSNIHTDCNGNKGGLSTRLILWNKYKADGTDTATITVDPTTGVITALTLADGVKPNVFEFRKQSSSVTSNGTVDDANGVSFFTTVVSLRFARQDSAKRLSITALMRSQVQGIYKDGNGEYWFIGFDDPVTATNATAETGVNSTDANQYTVELTDISVDLPHNVNAETAEALFNQVVEG